MAELGLLVFFIVLFMLVKADNAASKPTRPAPRPKYEPYQSKSPDTIQVPKIEGEYDGSFNKEFE